MFIDLLFYLGIALLFTHELDAIKRHEWRIFPFISRLPDDTAYHVFVLLHVPLFLLILWLNYHPSENVRYWFQLSMDVFFIVHLGLHRLFRRHAEYEFNSIFSKSIIFLNAVVGLAHWAFLINQNNL